MKKKNFFALLFLLLVSLYGFTQTPPPEESAPKEEPLPEEAQQQQWTDSFQQAETAFNSDNPASSIPLFQELIKQITEQRVRRELTQPEDLLLYRSLDYLGQAFFNEGQEDESRNVFLKLVELNPNYQLNEDLVSPKIVDFVRTIKQQNLGTMNVISTPPGATIKLDGNVIGVTNMDSVYGMKGDHDLVISKPGFVEHKETVTITPGKTLKINVPLERTSSVAYFITYPKGVEVYMSGKLLGVTSGDAPDRAKQTATDMNLPIADFSADFPIPDLAIGSYEVELRKPCWETSVRKFTIDKNDDFNMAPIALAPSNAYLNITADDTQASILIDNNYIGTAPKQKLQICSGKHVLKVKGPRGKFEKQIEAKKDETLTINAKLNPSLAFLGIVGSADVLKTDIDSLSAETAKQLSGLQNLNFVDNSGGEDRAGVDAKITEIIDGIRTNAPDKERKAKIQELCSKVESDLILVGFAPKERLQRTVEFYLLSNWSSMADYRKIQVFDAGQWKTLVSQLEYSEPLFQKRMGFNLVDTTITQGPVISKIELKTYQDAQPISPGDVLISVNGKPVKTAADAYAVLALTPDTDQATITVIRQSGQATVPLKLTNSPMEIRFDNPSLLFNRQIQTFEKSTASTNPLEKNVALLNIGLCYMHFGEYSEAFDQLRLVQLDRQQGIGPGTVQYRISQCYRELGYLQEAKDSLTDASRYAQNTIYSDDGPVISREIERAQKALQ